MMQFYCKSVELLMLVPEGYVIYGWPQVRKDSPSSKDQKKAVVFPAHASIIIPPLNPLAQNEKWIFSRRHQKMPKTHSVPYFHIFKLFSWVTESQKLQLPKIKFFKWISNETLGHREALGLFFSVDIMVFDFLQFVFFQVQYIHYCCWKHYVQRLDRNL